MPDFHYVVTVTTDSPAHAEQVMAERILFDEDYGFPYTINYGSEGEASAA